MFTQDELKEAFDYDAVNGGLIKRVKLWTKPKPMAVGYQVIYFMGKGWYEHRLVWFWHHGKWPEDQLDHIDRDKLNNRIENLRDVSNQINNFNKPMVAGDGRLPGVSFHKPTQKFQTGVVVNNKRYSLGLHDDPHQAHEIYIKAKRILHDAKALGQDPLVLLKPILDSVRKIKSSSWVGQ